MKIGEATRDIDLAAVRAAVAERGGKPAVEAPAAPAAPAPAQREVAVPKFDSIRQQIDTFLRSTNRSLQFRVDEATGRTVVTLRDAETGEVIRQIPGEDALRLAQSIDASIGAFLDAKA